ncbi:MAG: hypothetical protein COB78_13205 [Hyphomicrobiales bacterium]|nr:MAG: hypothetical protein COB78_13205 [Hyphomicrobiales bacterium]
MKFKTLDADIDLTIDHLFVAGWTGRNKEAVDHHIEELRALGISPPSQVPLYYRVSGLLLTQATTIDVLGAGTSGEVEPLLIQKDGKIWIGLASDHTDRDLETHSVAASKQACPKPVASELWRLTEVEDHLDSLILRCWTDKGGKWGLYQEGELSNIRPLSELISNSGFGDNAAMLCGTLGAIGGVRPASRYRMELVDPVLDRKIQLNYSVTKLPIVE